MWLWCVEQDEYYFALAIDSSGNSIMHSAARNGSLPVVQYLASGNLTFLKTHQNRHGYTPLHVAARYNQVRRGQILHFRMEYGI